MKKQMILVSSIALAFTLSACSDATANISDGSEALVTVGSEKVTKGDIYDALKSNIGNATLTSVKNEVYKKEGIEVTDEMQKLADSKLKTIKEQFGENYEAQIKQYGYENDQAVMDALIMPSIYQTELQKKYVTENKDKLFDSYHPLKAQIFQASDETKAKNALSALKDGKDFKEVVKEFGTTTSYDGSEKVYTSQSGLPTEVFSSMTAAEKDGLIDKVISVTTTSSTDGSSSVSYYIVKLTSIDTSKYEDEAIKAIAETNAIATEATKYYFKKYDMTIYDIDAYNSMKDYIVQ